MHTKVTGKQIDVGDALRLHVEGRLGEAVTKFFDRPVEGSVVFSRDGHGFKCDSTVHLPTGLTAKAHAQHNDIYAAFDQSLERIEKQLRRYHRRLKDHHHKRSEPIEAEAAPTYVIAGQGEEEAAAPAPENGAQPVIIAEMKTDIPSLSVGDAVMQMELAHAAFLMFRNDSNGRLNIVFQRDDGNIGWVDPAIVADS